MNPRRWRCIFPALACLLLLAESTALAQLTPERLYYGINRPAPMLVAAPTDAKGELEVQLLEPVTAKVLARAAVAPGRVDMAALFPLLWTAPEPRLVYAQLVVHVGDGAEAKERKIGPGVVLQPMLSPARAALDERNPSVPLVVYPPALQAEKKVYSGLRAYVDRHVVFDTTEGELRIALRPDAAPNTAFVFRELAAGGFYTDTPFHRIVPVGRGGKGFVIQGGDPTGTGDGTPGFEYALEPSTLQHDFGVVSMARDKDPNTNGCQFFICLSRSETARLDGLYCAFAQVVGDGAETIVKIGRTPLVEGSKEKPARAPVVRRAYLVDAPPYGEGPKPVQSPDAGPVER